jgi:hypothetical protein
MGAKGLFQFLRERYPSVFRTLTFPPKRTDPILRPEILLIDLLQIVAPAIQHDFSIDSHGRFTLSFHAEVIKFLKDIVPAVCPTRLIYIAEDGVAPFAKADESRRRVFDRLQHDRDTNQTFLANLPDSPEAPTTVWRSKLAELAKSARIWSSVDIIYDTQFVPGEAEHKFAAYYRKCVADGTFSLETRIVVFSGDSDLVNLSLLFHNPNITIMRSKTEVVSIGELRPLMAAAYGNRENRIDDLAVLSFFTGNDFLPGIAGFGDIENAYKQVCETREDCLVEGGTFNRAFLKDLLGKLGPIRGSTVDDLSLGERYLRTASWMLQYYVSGCPQWRFAYSSLGRPSLGRLIEAVDTFDSAFEMDEPMGRLAVLMIANSARTRADLPPECARLKDSPELSRYFRHDVPFEPFPLDLFMEIFERDIRPGFSDRYRAMDVVLEPVVIDKHSVDESLMDAPLAVGEAVIYQGRFRAIVVSIGPEGVVVEIDRTRVPDCSTVMSPDPGVFVPMSDCFSALRIKSGFYRVLKVILGSVMVDDVDCGFGVLRPESQTWVGRLGLVRLRKDQTDNVEIFLASRLAKAVSEWCRRASSIPQILAQNENKRIVLSREEAFPRRDNAAPGIRAWLDGEFGNSEVPLVEDTLSQEAMVEIAQRFRKALKVVMRRNVKESELLRQYHTEIESREIDWRRPVISICPDESCGCVGYVVGYSAIAQTAAVLFMQQNEAFTDFGCKAIGGKMGKEVPLDDLRQLPP